MCPHTSSAAGEVLASTQARRCSLRDDYPSGGSTDGNRHIAPAQDAALIAAGEAAWDKAGCQQCHGASGKAARRRIPGRSKPAGHKARSRGADRDHILRPARNRDAGLARWRLYEAPLLRIPAGPARTKSWPSRS